jgi:hypothetical protein
MDTKLISLKNEVNELTPKLFIIYNDRLSFAKETLRAQI